MSKSGRWARATAAVSAGVLLVTLTGPAPASARPEPGLEDRSGWSEEQRRAHGQDIAPQSEATDLVESTNAPVGTPVSFDPMPTFDPEPVSWPAARTTVQELRAGRGLPVRGDGFAVRARRDRAVDGKGSAPGQLRTQVLERAASQRAGVDGVLLKVTNPTGDAASVQIAVDYAPLAVGYGADWASRARLVRLPDCALTTPQRPECRTQTPLAASNDPVAASLTATLDSASMGVLALAAGTTGSTGDWSATPLSASASWQVSAQTGAFTWSYPMRVPPAVGGPQPELALSYSAASLDGRVASTNNQTSWIGDGWGLETGYVERKYVSCSQDMAGGNNATRETYDQCWRSDNATLVFNGQASELVKDATTGTWRVKNDDGTRIEHLTGGWNADNDGEYWKVTTPDGTAYYFGRGQRSATDSLALNSAWTVPVFGNHPGDPCYQTAFASSSCTQAWRWNLDYVVDTSSNTLTYVYAAETNNYGRNLGTAVSSYVRGGYLARIEYGQRQGTEATTPAPAQVLFDVTERCLPAGGVTCAPEELTAATASSWPDVPFDLICTSTTSCPAQVSPAFFTRKRLTTITTQVRSGSGYQNVDRWSLTHTFPSPGDGTGAALWLDKIGHTGLVGGSVTLPDVQLYGTQMPNRVDTIGDYGPPMNRYRITGITSETGATISVNYTPADCTTSSLPAAPDANTRRCQPVVWDPEGGIGPITEYFHKYLVDSVVANPGTGVSVETHYRYLGDPAWRYDDSPLTPAEFRTWGDFRGYESVDVVTGTDTEPVRPRTRYRYFRGMDGDHLAAGGTRTATLDGITDQDRLNGFMREQITYDGTQEVTASLTRPWISPPTATGADGTTAAFLAPDVVEQRTTLGAGGTRTTRTITTYDPTYGTPTTVDDLGDVAITTDDRCTRTEYARNLTANILSTVVRSETVAVSCATTPTRPDDVIADTRTFYDGAAFAVAPTRGLPTTNQRVALYNGSTPTYVTEATTTYDAHGRPLTVTDALGRTTTTAYTPTTGGPVTRTTTTSPDPDGAGPLTAHVATTDVNPAWGSPTSVTDPNGKVTTATYDPLGRLTAVWQPGRPQATKSANTTYEYTISTTGVNTVTTKTLTASETYLTAVTLYDGLLRERQTQSPALSRGTPGRIVTDKAYDSRGLLAYANSAWATTGAPSTTLVYPTESVPARTRYVYDGAGRTTAEIFDINHVEAWRTTTTYGGDRVNVDPPVGAVPTTTISDARGRTTELRQYLGNAPAGTYQATTYTYDTTGHLAGMSDPVGNHWSSAYDLRGRRTSTSDPDKGVTTTTYDDAGQVTTTTDARGETLAYVYDALGRKIATYGDTPTGSMRASWSYDTLAKGQLTSSTRYDEGVEYVTAVTGYDDGYRPLGHSVVIPPTPSTQGGLAGTYTTSYTYAPNGQLKTTKLPAAGGLPAETITTYYDALSLPEWMSGGLGFGVYVAGSLYSAYGEPVQYDLGGSYSAFVNFSYQTGTRRIVDTSVWVEGATGYDLDLAYTYDAAGNPTSIIDTPDTRTGDAQCFTYDALRRLSAAWTPADGNCTTTPTVAGLGGAAPYWFTDSYDPSGNRTQHVQRTTEGSVTTNYTYPKAQSPQPHTLTQSTIQGPSEWTTSNYAYDPAGNTTTRAVAGQPTQTLTWDPEGELTTLAATGQPTDSYLYSADETRILRRQDGATTAYLPGGEELTLTSTGQVKATRYYTFNATTVAVRTGTGTAGVTNLVGTTHGTAEFAFSSSTRTVTRRYTDPYGRSRGTTPNTWAGDHGYLDKPTDTTGLTAIGARYYDPDAGRFISVDPLMDLTDPQQWHGYAYANNNPITYSDPTGLMWDGSTASYRYTHQSATGGYMEKMDAWGFEGVQHTAELWSVGAPKTTKSMAKKVDQAVQQGKYGQNAGEPQGPTWPTIRDTVGAFGSQVWNAMGEGAIAKADANRAVGDVLNGEITAAVRSGDLGGQVCFGVCIEAAFGRDSDGLGYYYRVAVGAGPEVGAYGSAGVTNGVTEGWSTEVECSVTVGPGGASVGVITDWTSEGTFGAAEYTFGGSVGCAVWQGYTGHL